MARVILCGVHCWKSLSLRPQSSTRPRETDVSVCHNDVRLASIFHACLQPPRAAVLVPRLFADRYYRGTQEDAEEFLRQAILQDACSGAGRGSGSLLQFPTVSSLASLCRGQQEYRFRCVTCGHFREGSQAQTFTTLQLPLTTADGVQRFTTVQEALDRYLATEGTDTSFQFQCERCHGTEPPERHTRLLQCPRVLILAMKRWIAAGDRGALLHAVSS